MFVRAVEPDAEQPGAPGVGGVDASWGRQASSATIAEAAAPLGLGLPGPAGAAERLRRVGFAMAAPCPEGMKILSDTVRLLSAVAERPVGAVDIAETAGAATPTGEAPAVARYGPRGGPYFYSAGSAFSVTP